jgi:hypothetical protein
MDVVFKLEAQQLGTALARRFGLDLPPVVRYVPTDRSVADVHLEQLDAVFELDAGSLVHLEFQTEHRPKTLKRFLLYDANLYDRFERPIHTLVIYGANVATAASEIAGGTIQYSVVSVLLGQQDGEATYRHLRAQVDSGGGLTPEERLDLIFLPLMKQRRARQEVIAGALDLARQLPEHQQEEALAARIGLGHRFLTERELDTLVEGLMSTSLGQRLIDRGMVQARQQDVLVVLTRRFGAPPPAITERIAQIDDAQRLEMILGAAATAASLEEFARDLGKARPQAVSMAKTKSRAHEES